LNDVERAVAQPTRVDKRGPAIRGIEAQVALDVEVACGGVVLTAACERECVNPWARKEGHCTRNGNGVHRSGMGGVLRVRFLNGGAQCAFAIRCEAHPVADVVVHRVRLVVDDER